MLLCQDELEEEPCQLVGTRSDVNELRRDVPTGYGRSCGAGIVSNEVEEERGTATEFRVPRT